MEQRMQGADVPPRRRDWLLFVGMVAAHFIPIAPTNSFIVSAVILLCYVVYHRRSIRRYDVWTAKHSALHKRCRALEASLFDCRQIAETVIEATPRDRLFDLPQ